VTPALARELLALPHRHPTEMRALVSVAGWVTTLRRRGDTGPIRYGRTHTSRGVAAEDAVRVILAEARKVAGLGGPSAQRGPQADQEVAAGQGESESVHGASVERARRSGELVPA